MKRFILTLFLITNIGINAQVPFCVAPLKVGNIWVYTDILSSLKLVRQVTDSIITINDNKYQQVRTYSYYPGRTPYPPLYFYMLCRYDSTDGTYKYYDRNGRFKYSDYTYYKKGSVPGDRWTSAEPNYKKRTVYSTVMDSATVYAFNFISLLARHVFITDSNNTYTDEFWTDELGIIKRGEDGALYFLTGCAMDGKIYGDTSRTLTGLHDEKRDYPVSICLYQNYPNPFNLQTTISYNLSKNAFVTLYITDIQGRIIKNLVHNTMSKGFNSIVWDGSDNRKVSVSSGIYFIILIENGKVHYRKAILHK